jgi:CheY-like chemotaxis protein
MRQPKILIVDDDENNRAVLSDALAGEHYALLEAANGNDALKVVDKEIPDLILLDEVMAGMDGITTLRKLKEQEKTRPIPVIMVTVLNQASQVSIFMEEGAFDHISKPFTHRMVRARVRSALRACSPDLKTELPDKPQGEITDWIGANGGGDTTTSAGRNAS